MKDYKTHTSSGWEIVEIWKSSYVDDYFVIAKRDNDYCWGSYYDFNYGCWGQGHYDYETLQKARWSMLKHFERYDLDLVKKYDIKGVEQ